MLEKIEDLDGFFLSYMPSSGRTGEVRDTRLERMECLLRGLGNPERCYKTIHLAGSKGKGTTATILSKAITSTHKCGLYRSPHVYDLRERFTIAGEFLSDREYLDAALLLSSKISDLDFKPTTFELYTAYAYLLFKSAGCEYAVIETGLGGRLDATNTIDSIMEILLPIEKEHTEILGDTIEKISIEKSKIIKRNSTVIVSDVDSVALRVFENEAREKSCDLFSFCKDIKNFRHREEKDHSLTCFSIDGRVFEFRTALRTAEIGKNFATATLALSRLGLLSDHAIKAMEKVKIEGRFEERRVDGKTIVLDVAHTPHSILNLISTFSLLYGERKSVLIFSTVSGKDYKSMLSSLLPHFNKVIITRAGTFKPSDPEGIYAEAMRLKRKEDEVYLIKDEKTAFDLALKLGDTVLITGSFYLVGEYGGKDAQL